MYFFSGALFSTVILVVTIVLLVVYLTLQQRSVADSGIFLTSSSTAEVLESSTFDVTATSKQTENAIYSAPTNLAKTSMSAFEPTTFLLKSENSGQSTTASPVSLSTPFSSEYPLITVISANSEPMESTSLQMSTSTTVNSNIITTSTVAPETTITNVVTYAGSGSATSINGFGRDAGFNDPITITFNALDNSTYVADYGSGAIRKINATGYVSTFVNGSTISSIDGDLSVATFKLPIGITVDRNGTIFVSDRTSLLRNISGGIVRTLAGNSGSMAARDGLGTAAIFNQLNQLSLDKNGNIYTSEEGGRIRKIDKNGNVTTLNSIFFTPRGIAFDRNTNMIYIADSGNHAIKRMDLNGNVNVVAGSTNGQYGFANGNSTTARFRLPTGLTIDLNGNLIIADSSNNAIRRLNLTSFETSTIAGNTNTGSKNGFGNESTFSFPRGVTVDQDGSILVVDRNNNLIRKISFTEV
jgi:sugar lactone lactonase YvrE